MSFKKILAVMLSAVTACSISAAALTLDVAEAAKEANVAEAAALADATEYVVSVNGTSYASLSEALSAVAAGDNTVTFLADISENVTIKQQKDVNITIDGNGKTYTGTMSVNGSNRASGEETLTIKNVNFVAEGDWQISVKTVKSTQVHHLTVDSCSFTGNDAKRAYGIHLRHVHNVVVKNTTGTKLYDLVYGQNAVTGFTADNITVTDSVNAIWLSYVNSTANITNLTADVSEVGVGFRNNAGGTVTVADSDITAVNPLCLQPVPTADIVVSLVVDGDNDFNGTSESGDWLVVTSDDASLVVDVKDPDLDKNAVSGSVASINDIYYGTFEAALAASVDGDVIDLLGKTIKLDNTNKEIKGKNLTLKNGTFDITNGTWGGNSIFDIQNANVAMTNVDFVGENYSSAFGVIYAHKNSTVTLNDCDFNLKNEKYKGGGVLKGETVGQSGFVVNGGSFNLENPNRIIANATVDLDNVKIRAAVTDNTLVVGVMNNHAFRNLVGTVTDCDIAVSGFETGIKNTDGDLVIDGTSVIKLENSKTFDFVLDKGKKVTVAETAKLYYDTSDIKNNSAVEGEGVVAKANVVEVVFNLNEKSNADEGYKVYDIVVVGSNNEIINRLNTADLTFSISSDKVSYEIIPVAGITVTNEAGTERYMFNFNGKPDGVADTANAIVIAEVKFAGYDAFEFTVADETTNLVTATTISDNIVDYFNGNGLLIGDDAEAEVDTDAEVETGVIKDEIKVPTRKLTVNVTFPNTVVDRDALYQNMTVTVSGGDIAEAKVFNLGADTKADAAYTVEADLTKNISYNVVVSGAGYRTARYTVTMTKDKTVNFWNNVKDNDTVVEEGKYSEKKNFLAGDIVGDNNINIYDLSAVVSYFATEITDEADYDKYVKYDLNRDGVIDSKDVAYVLVSWGA